MKNLDTNSIKDLIYSELRKEIERIAAAHPDAEGHEWVKDVGVERIEELGKGLYKVTFSYTRCYLSSHMTNGALEHPRTGFIVINESLKVEEVG